MTTMTFSVKYYRKFPLLLAALFLGLATVGCSSSRYISQEEIESTQAIKVIVASGSSYQGLVIKQDPYEITMVLENDHTTQVIKREEIRRVEKLDTYYDMEAYPISGAEIEKYKENRNAWGFAAGGAVAGGLAGLAVGVPLWLANDNPPPLFVAGLGAVVSSIYFVSRGIERDREAAVEKVRYIRTREKQMKAQTAAEQEELEKLKRQQEELRQQLKKKKKNGQ